ncbi:MAG: hypothetical protein Tsb0013_12650 [Phycisphaerales bacterium]
MADEPVQSDDAGAGEPPAKQGLLAKLPIPKLSGTPLRGVKDVWQFPALLLAAGLIGGAIYTYTNRAPEADFPGALASVEAHLEARQYDGAMQILNGPILANLDDPAITGEDLARFWALRADTLYLLARDQEIDRAENHKAIVDNYTVARSRYDHELTARQYYRLADTLLALGDYDGATKEAQSIAEELADRRRDIYQRVIEHGLRTDAGPADRDRSYELLARLRNDPSSTPDDRLWAVVRQSRLSIESNNPEDALRRLLPELQRQDTRTSPESGRLFALLGEAYFDMGLLDESRKHLELAEQILEPTDPDAGRVGVLIARIDRVNDQPELARDRFRNVATRFPTHPVGVAGWLGVAETEADLANFEAARMAYQQVILGLSEAESVGDVTVGRVHDSLAQRHDQRVASADFVGALRFATLAERLFEGGRVPPEAVDRLARAHRAVAEELMSTQPLTPEGVVDLRASDPTTLEQARRHFASAAERFLAHARMTLLGDPEVSRDALWEAADAYDHAGDLDQATELFGEFVEATHNDPRQLEGRYRLGKAWLGRAGYDNAIAFFESLLTDHATSEEAYLSYVPLARAYLLASDWKDTERAERLLLRVLDGQTFTPSAPEYRSALLELGALYRKIGRTTESIERMTEAIERYPELGDDPGFTFDLADANRLEADAIGERLRESMPASERARLEGLRIDRLDRASNLYERARTALMDEDERTRTDLEEQLIRNALIYRADCAFDKAGLLAKRDPEESEKLYRQAIRRYDNAAQRYADDPAALSAMMQVVNCYAALGDLRAARIAHERARERLAQLPDSAFENTSSPFNRTQWEKWLDSAVELDRFAQLDSDTGDGG